MRCSFSLSIFFARLFLFHYVHSNGSRIPLASHPVVVLFSRIQIYFYEKYLCSGGDGTRHSLTPTYSLTHMQTHVACWSRYTFPPVEAGHLLQSPEGEGHRKDDAGSSLKWRSK